MSDASSDIRLRLGVRPVINLTGTLTSLGGIRVIPEAAQAAVEMMDYGVDMVELQAQASRIIARVTGAEAGFVAGCTSAGICMTIAGAMTGDDLARIERLPDTKGMKDEVVIQHGHVVDYGHSIGQDIRLTGARMVTVGHVNSARPHQLSEALGERTAAALYVVSHHTVQFGQIPFPTFVGLCRERGVPVIVDLAAEYDLRGYHAQGADATIHSGQKFLGGPTSGVVSGTKSLMRAAFLQNFGIGRPMKLGKEGVAGLLAALEAWEQRDHAGERAVALEVLTAWQRRFSQYPGISAAIDPDPTRNPFDRLKVTVDPRRAGLTAWELVHRLEQGQPPIVMRTHQLEFGYFIMDLRSLRPGEQEVVAQRVCEELEAAREGRAPTLASPQERRLRQAEALRRWPGY